VKAAASDRFVGAVALIFGVLAWALMLGSRNPMLVIGAGLSVGFLFCALVGQAPYEAACRAVFAALSPE